MIFLGYDLINTQIEGQRFTFETFKGRYVNGKHKPGSIIFRDFWGVTQLQQLRKREGWSMEGNLKLLEIQDKEKSGYIITPLFIKHLSSNLAPGREIDV